MAGSSGRAVKPAIVLLTALVTAGHDAIAVVAPASVAATLDDLAAVLAADGGAIRRAIADLAAHAATLKSRAAVDRLLSGHQEAPRLGHLERALAAAGDIRDRAVFEHAVLGLGPLVTKHDLGTNLGIGYNGCASSYAARRRGSTWRSTSCRPSWSISPPSWPAPSAPPRRWPPWIRHSPPSACRRCRTRSRLLLRLAGPYRAIEGHLGWAATDPAELVGETRRLLSDDGGVNLLTDVTRALMCSAWPTPTSRRGSIDNQSA